MNKQMLEQKIRNAVEHAAPDQLDRILSSCEDQINTADDSLCYQNTGEQKKGVIDMTKKESWKKRGKSRFAAIAAIAAAFVICFGGFYLFAGSRNLRVDSVIMLDVNPSISLSVDEKERVIEAEPLNEDAKVILGSMELKNTTLEVAVNAIIGSMLREGYLGDIQNSILVSVENQDAARGEALQKKISEIISGAMQTDSLEAAILSQNVSADDTELKALAEKYNISLGKAALIKEVIAEDSTLTFEKLSPMTINEIALIAGSKNLTSEAISQSGSASDKAYITREDALKRACAHAGFTAEEVSQAEVEFDSEDGVIVYEIDFTVDQVEYEYDIDACTGEILKFETKDRGSKQTVTIPQSGTDSKNENTGNTGNDGTGKSQSGSTGENADYIGEEAAKNAALSDAGVKESDTSYIECSLDYDDGRPEHYSVEFAAGNTEYEYEIDLYSGAVLESSRESYGEEHHHSSHSSHASHNASDSSSYIGESAALSAALNHAGISEAEVTGKKTELDRDDGRAVYEVEFDVGQDEYEYEIDAVTGEILKYESDLHRS